MGWRRNVVPEIPEACRGIMEAHRFKVLYGGRGSAKSWTAARVLLAEAASKPQAMAWRTLCSREIQKSIKESVHQVLAEQVVQMNIEDLFEIQDQLIRGRRKTQAEGAEFFFSGLRHNIDSIKSVEGIVRCWVEEAHLVRKTSWDKLIPTIRRPGSEIIITFNPELDTDETFQRFVVHPPPDAWVKKVTWADNPWFWTTTGPEDMKATKRRSEDDYQNIWGGNTRQTLEGAVYAKEMREATAEGRICRVPYDARYPVSTYWDLGFADATAIWFVQKVGFEYHAIDYHEDRQHTIEHYIRVLQGKPYMYDTDYLPHDGAAQEIRTGKSVEEIMRTAGRQVKVLSRSDPSVGINAARTIFPQIYFDQDHTAEGLQALRHYRYDVNPDTGQFSSKPLHDQWSHGADGLRTFAMAVREPRSRHIELREPMRPLQRARGAAWMR